MRHWGLAQAGAHGDSQNSQVDGCRQDPADQQTPPATENALGYIPQLLVPFIIVIAQRRARRGVTEGYVER